MFFAQNRSRRVPGATLLAGTPGAGVSRRIRATQEFGFQVHRALFLGQAPRQKQQTRCAGCSQIVPSYDIVNVGSVEKGYRVLCGKCFNTEMAELDGLDRFEHVTFEPVQLADCTGENHKFHFRTHLFGTGVALDAFELRDGHPAGYQFQIIGDPQEDLLVLLGQLIEKMRRGLSIKHVKCDEFGLQIADRLVRGKIEWDDSQGGSVPILNIDGREVTWQEFGRMLMSFEGWQFKLEIRDKSEDF